MSRTVSCFAISCALLGSVIAQQTTNCSRSQRELNLQSCLNGIRSLVRNDEVFWFGSSFSQWCPNGNALQPSGCRIPAGMTIPESISSLTFTPGSSPLSRLDRYLDVVYTSPPGSYVGCGNEFRFDQTNLFTIDPLSLRPIDAWYTRDPPRMTWGNSPNQYYTLIMKDVGYNFLHAVYINIPGDDISRAKTILPYVGPGSPHRFGNVYVFMLFSQSGMMTLDSRYNITGPQPLNISEFAQVQNLTGPIGMNWVLARGDPYNAERIRRRCCVDNCANFVGNASLQTKPRPFLPAKPVFTVFVNVTYISKAIDFRSCCSHYHYEAKNVSLNPLGQGMVMPGHARDKPLVELYPSIVFFNPETGFGDTLYTLLMVDPDVPYPFVGTNSRPLIHWLVVNIPNGKVNEGQELVRYMLPSPPDTPAHTYYFLLYKQDHRIEDRYSFMRYVGRNCSDGIEDRCLFDVSGFAMTSELELVGASWMLVRRDEYVRYSRASHGESEEKMCKEVPGYKKYCDMIKAGSQTPAISALSVLFACIHVVGMAMLIW